MSALDTYEGQVERLDLDYVRQAGRMIADHLGEGCAGPPCGLSYQPDNGTAYALVFVPSLWMVQLSSSVNPPHGHWYVPSGSYDRHGNPHRGQVLVSKVNGATSDFSYPFDLRPGSIHSCDYVMEHTRTNIADGAALTALLRAICDLPIGPGEAR
jgi:hypothetical protein